jgi:preprotein translocase YajC subunit
MNPAEISFVIIVGVMAAFYIIFIRPARQEQTRLEGTIRELRVGDEVITTAGFFAHIRQIETPEEGPVQLVLDFGNGVQVRSLTTSILRRLSTAPEASDQPEQVKGT